MVLGHNDNIELSAVNITLGGTAAGLTAMMVKLLKPQFQYFYQFYNPLSSQGKTKHFDDFVGFFKIFNFLNSLCQKTNASLEGLRSGSNQENTPPSVGRGKTKDLLVGFEQISAKNKESHRIPGIRKRPKKKFF